MLLSVLSQTVNIIVSCIMIIVVVIVQGYIHPYKNSLVNVQDLVLLFIYIMLCFLVLLNRSELLNIIIINILVGLSFIQCLVYHTIAFVSPCSKALNTATGLIKKYFNYRRPELEEHQQSTGMEIPEVAFNFANFQEPLLGED